MHLLTKLSILFAAIGALLLGSSTLNTNSPELLMGTGLVVLFLGVVLSFGAMFKREKGNMKFLAVAVFFLFSFLLTWNDPFQIVRLLTWIKN